MIRATATMPSRGFRVRATPLVAALAVAGCLGLRFGSFDLAQPGVTIAACAAIGAFGFPHGALDIELIRGGHERVAAILAVYLGVAAGMAGLWLVAPLIALGAFLTIAVLHFAEDWTTAGSRIAATGIAVAVLATPALLHHADVAAIFVGLTGTPVAAAFATGLASVAPAALAVAAWGIARMLARRAFADAAAAAASLVALAVLPPAAGFAVFFCLFHSPRHFAAARREANRWQAARWAPVVIPVMLAAAAIVVVLYVLHPAPTVSGRLTAAIFTALSILTAPHMLAPALVDRVRRMSATGVSPAAGPSSMPRRAA